MPECVGMAAPLPGAGSPNLSPVAAAPQLRSWRRSSGEGAVTCRTPWPAAAQPARYLPPFHQNTRTRTAKQSRQGDFHNTGARAFTRAF